MVPNEARTILGLPHIDGGNVPMEMTPRQATDAIANNAGNRERDSQRANNSSDGPTTTAGRNPKGEGRSSK